MSSSIHQRTDHIFLDAKDDDSQNNLRDIFAKSSGDQQPLSQPNPQRNKFSDGVSLLARADMSTDYTVMSNSNTPVNKAAGGGSSATAPLSPATEAAGADHHDKSPKFASRLVLAVVNPLSGERRAAEGLTNSLLSVLGEQRVMKLSASVFRDSRPIGLRIAEGVQRVVASRPADAFDGSTNERRMSLVVAGGDGTVSFVMGIIETLVADPSSGLNGVMPAIMVIPMGTGNDLSNAMGYGLGFTTFKCCCCCPNDVEQLLRAGLEAPVIPFDRWNSTLYRAEQTTAQLVAAARDRNTNVARLLQDTLQQQRVRKGGASSLDDLAAITANFTGAMDPSSSSNSLSHVTAASGIYSSKAEVFRQAEQRVAARKSQQEGTPKEQAAAAAAAVSSSDGPSGPANISFATIASFDFNNYFSFGLDAAIAGDFDDKRRKYPSCHTNRTMNKMWYGYHGLVMAIGATPFHNSRVSICCDKNEIALSDSQDGCRAFVVANIPSYSGGVDLWNVEKPGQFQQTIPVPPGLPGKAAQERAVTYQPTNVSDGMLEVVTLGGVFHMGFMRMGWGGDKVAQGGSLTFALADFDNSNELKGKSLTFQVDGEPAGDFSYDPGALIVDIKIQSRAYFHKLPTPK